MRTDFSEIWQTIALILLLCSLNLKVPQINHFRSIET